MELDPQQKNGETVIPFDVKKAGIAPAMLEKRVVTGDGMPVESMVERVKRCCASAGGLDAIRRIDFDGHLDATGQ